MRTASETPVEHLRRCVEGLRTIARENMERYALNTLAEDIEDSLNDLESGEYFIISRVDSLVIESLNQAGAAPCVPSNFGNIRRIKEGKT